MRSAEIREMVNNIMWSTLSLVLYLVLVAATTSDLIAQGTIRGRVVDDMGRALTSSLVDIPGTSTGVVADSNGIFSIADVPEGEHLLRARFIGYETAIRSFRVGSGETIQILFQLSPRIVDFDGTDPPLPPTPMLSEAERLVQRVLAEPLVTDYVGERLLSEAAVTVWIPWSRQMQDSARVAGRLLELVSVCAGCARETGYTMEGGRTCRSAMPHLRVGVTGGGSEVPALTFCVDAADSEVFLMANCYGTGHTVTVSYLKQPNGQWIRVSRE